MQTRKRRKISSKKLWVRSKVQSSEMPLFGKKDSGKKVRKDGHKDIDKQIINIEDKYILRQVLGKWVWGWRKFNIINLDMIQFCPGSLSCIVVVARCELSAWARAVCIGGRLQMSRSLHLIIIKTAMHLSAKWPSVDEKLYYSFSWTLSTQALWLFCVRVFQSFYSFEFN